MQEPAVTLEAGGSPLARTAATQAPHQPGIGPMKFTYATGARPLDGYTIKRGVGMGGFGEVYFATSDAGKEVALKRIQRNLAVEIRGVTHCLNLKHANLISIYDIKYDDQGEAWIVMEFVAGESLKDVIDRNPIGMPLDEMEFWFSGIAAGVAYLHDHGVVHRDLKPANIFYDEGVVKIGDYGLSKFISCSRRSGQTESVGTFHYMAPEIGKGVYGKEIDVYALGIILFEMLTGRVPFEGESSQEIIMKHLTASPDLSDIPLKYRRVIERALYKDPAKRYSDVDEMLRVLQRGERAQERPPVLRAEVILDDPSSSREPLYISDEGITTDEIIFGPVVDADAKSGGSTAPEVTVTGREPVAAAVGAGYHRVANWWNTANLSTPLKVVIIVVAIGWLVLNSEWLVPMTVTLGIAYLIYMGIRALVVGPGRSSRAASQTYPVSENPRRHATGTRRNHRRRRRPRVPWQQHARETLRRKPTSQRLTELTGSLLMSAIVSAVLCLLVMVLGGRTLDGSVDTWTFYAWMTVSSIIGSWLVLGLAKLWEGRDGDAVLRRFVMLVVGLVIGLAAFAMADMLMIRLAGRQMFNILEMPSNLIPSAMYAADGTPYITAFLAYFSALFLVLRWWRQADPLRKTRYSLWATIVCMLLAMLIPWQIPWGFLLAATISVAVQLSAPWMTSEERSRVRREALEV